MYWKPSLQRYQLTILVGTPLYGMKIKSNGEPDEITILRGGIFDDIEILNQHKPAAELFVNGRVSWICPLEGAGQLSGMPPLPFSSV